MEDNISDISQEYNRRVADALLPNIVIYSIILSIGALGNAFVLYVYAVRMRQEQLESRYFIPALSFYDLLACITSQIYFLSDTYMWVTFHSDAFCKAILALVGMATMTSAAFLLAIAVQRYVKICRSHKKQMTLNWRRFTVVAVISANIIYTIPIPFVAGVKDLETVYKGQNVSGPSCFTGNQQYPMFQLIFYSITILIIIANIIVTAGLYTPIACIIYKKFHRDRKRKKEPVSASSDFSSNNCQSGSTSEQTGEKRPSRIQRFLSKRHSTPESNFNHMFFTIIFVYVLSYVPTCIMLIIVSLDDHFWLTLPFEQIGIFNWLIRSYVINHAANPFIYAYYDLGFRRNITKLFRRRPSGKYSTS